MRALRPKYYGDSGLRFLSDDSDVPETLSAFNVEIKDDFGVTESPRETHSNRSARSRSMDEKFNAPVTLDVEKWREDPNRYDLPGVDTIPYDEERRRGVEFTDRVQEAGLVDKVKEDGRMSRAMGRFRVRTDSSGVNREIWLNPAITDNPDVDPRFREGPVRAHEAGHAIDHDIGYSIWNSLRREGESGATDEVRDVSRMMRGDYSNVDPSRREYRDSGKELIADFFASYAIQPRATRREAPRATEIIEKRLPW